MEKGILKYAKRGSDVRIHLASAICLSSLLSSQKLNANFNLIIIVQLQKGKIHGCIDVGLSVMSIKKKAMCVDLDTEDNIYHLKVMT